MSWYHLIYILELKTKCRSRLLNGWICCILTGDNSSMNFEHLTIIVYPKVELHNDDFLNICIHVIENRVVTRPQ